MALNSEITAATRTPRGLVKVNGSVVSAWTTWTVDNNSFFSADTFRVSFALSHLDGEHSADWFSQQKQLEVEILAGFPRDPANPQDDEMTSLIVGQVDTVDLNMASRELELSGRDLSAHFIDNKTAPGAYRNQTASDVAKQLAAKYGLTPEVTDTTTKVGTYWDQDHIGLTDQRSEWDVLTFLAAQEGFIVFVQGRTLHFGPSPFLEPPTEFYELTWDGTGPVSRFNGKQVTFSRALTVAKGVVVTALSYQTKNKRAITAAYPKASKGIGAGRATTVGGTVQNYRLRLPPNKSVLEVEQAAKRRYDEIVAHEMKLSATLPADHYLDIRTALKVSGTGTAFDQVYYPDSIVRTMTMDSGYLMEIQAKNTAPENQPNL